MSRLFTFLTASGPNTDIDACSTRSRSICGGGAPGRGLDRCVRLPIARSARGTASRTHNRGPGDVHAEPTPGRASDPYGRPASGRSRGPSAGSGKLNQSTPSGDVERPEWIHSEHARFQMPGEGSPGIVTAEAKGVQARSFIPACRNARPQRSTEQSGPPAAGLALRLRRLEPRLTQQPQRRPSH